MMQNGPPLTTNGVGANFDFVPKADTKKMDERNVPTAVIEIIGPNGSLGDWVASDWISDPGMMEALWRIYAGELGADMAQIDCQPPQPTAGGGGRRKKFEFRDAAGARLHAVFVDAPQSHAFGLYRASDIPKDFRSRVRLQNPKTGENREAEIFMNSPLRYRG